MIKNILIGFIVVLLLIVGIIFIRSRNKDIVIFPTLIEPTPTLTTSPAPSLVPSISEIPTTPQVIISNLAYAPPLITTKAGTMIVWLNNDNVSHTITSDDGVFDSQPIQPGETFSFVFNDTGTFPYHCSIHTSMKGNVVVVE